MSGVYLQPNPARPGFTRSRSHTNPSDIIPTSDSQRLTRPALSDRSHSFLTPSAPPTSQLSDKLLPTSIPNPDSSKSSSTISRPNLASPLYPYPHTPLLEPSPRHTLRHRLTRSDSHHHLRRAPSGPELPHITSSLRAERYERRRPHLTRTRSYLATDPRSPVDNVLRRRATSDPHAPVSDPIAQALAQKDAQTRARLASVTKQDVDAQAKLAREAEEELRWRLKDVGARGGEVSRRLDYTYYSLLEDLGGLRSVVSNFGQLIKQVQRMGEAFQQEAEQLQRQVGGKVARFDKGFKERSRRLEGLELRGKRMGERARELGERLDKCRREVEEWEERGRVVVQRRGRMWKGIMWAVGAVLLFVVCIITYKEWTWGMDPVKAGLGVPGVPGGHWNDSLRLVPEMVASRHDVPDEVKTILRSIEERQRNRTNTWMLPTLPAEAPVEATLLTKTEEDNDARLRALDEL